ncbi:MAG: hypothetical protein HQK53_15270 [Oligoflexia bacterium]|nr:hypothetical protein [Oligoflexia bacterium]
MKNFWFKIIKSEADALAFYVLVGLVAIVVIVTAANASGSEDYRTGEYGGEEYDDIEEDIGGVFGAFRGSTSTGTGVSIERRRGRIAAAGGYGLYSPSQRSLPISASCPHRFGFQTPLARRGFQHFFSAPAAAGVGRNEECVLMREGAAFDTIKGKQSRQSELKAQRINIDIEDSGNDSDFIVIEDIEDIEDVDEQDGAEDEPEDGPDYHAYCLSAPPPVPPNTPSSPVFTRGMGKLPVSKSHLLAPIVSVQ